MTIGGGLIERSRAWLPAVTLGGTVTGAGQTLSNLGMVYIGDTAHGVIDLGLVINQGASTKLSVALKGSSVATGLTTAPQGNDAETDDFCTFEALNAAYGGIRIKSLMEDGDYGAALLLDVIGSQANTTKSTDGRALAEIYVAEHNGSNTLANITANGNIFGVRGYVGGTYATQLLLDEDGDLWINGGISIEPTAYTASGAIKVQGFVTLNQAGSAILMTLANPGVAGLHLTICQIDAGTQGHTVTTATGGGFDGTNNTATFNAQNETLVLVSISSTRWAIIQNIGAVGLGAV